MAEAVPAKAVAAMTEAIAIVLRIFIVITFNLFNCSVLESSSASPWVRTIRTGLVAGIAASLQICIFQKAGDL